MIQNVINDLWVTLPVLIGFGVLIFNRKRL